MRHFILSQIRSLRKMPLNEALYVTMNASEAQKKVLSIVKEPNIGICGETSEYESCFVVYYQSEKYISSGEMRDMLVGHGPVLVCKSTGKVFQGGSLDQEEKMVRAFIETGNPFSYRSSMVLVESWEIGASAVDAIKLIRKVTGLPLNESKSIIDLVLGGSTSEVNLESPEIAEEFVKDLSGFGFNSRQVWCGDI